MGVSHFFDLDLSRLQDLVQAAGLPRFGAAQIAKWVYERNVTDPQQMTDLSLRDRQWLAENIRFHDLKVIRHQVATDGTQKLLLELGTPAAAGELHWERGTVEEDRKVPRSQFQVPSSTECVMIPSENEQGRSRRTACISSQVGCPVGCRFCASGIGGLEKDLTAGQIVEQVWWLNQLPQLKSQGLRISNIVFMGMGEPLSNFQNVVRAIRTINADWGLNISARKITVSTVGLPAQIRRLAEVDLPITLAISLHAPNDGLRRQLIPWAQYTSVQALLDAAKYYFQITGREVTLEYILLGGVNDRPEHALELARLARELRGYVNLIRYNEVKGMPFKRPEGEDVLAFQKILQQQGIKARIRASRGRDIAAACGQLRHETALLASG